jgi:hypothetical protein
VLTFSRVIKERLERANMLRIAFLILLFQATASSQQFDLNVNLMQTTFLVKGPAKTGTTMGTAFLLLRPYATQPDTKSVIGRPVLVTAAHVFEEMVGDEAEILLRTQSGSGQWRAQRARFAIRRAGTPLWKTLPDIDVAAIYVSWPLPSPGPVPTNLLADDAMLSKEEAGPGDELKVLGYPLGNPSNDAFFPILRTGVIASYPLLPTSSTRTFLLDFRVFKGNSGGPVYYAPRELPGSAIVCCSPQFIMGLVSQEASLDMPYSELQLSLGVIVHASLVKAVIDSLPTPETREAQDAATAVEIVR